MPFKSKAQQRYMFWAASKGGKKGKGITKKMAKEWAKKTPDIKELPERVAKKRKGK